MRSEYTGRRARSAALAGWCLGLLLSGAPRAAQAQSAWSELPLAGRRAELLPRLGLRADVPRALVVGEIVRTVHQARDPKSTEYFRMFMMPGVLHCAGGPGPDAVDWASVIDTWVDKGQAPDRVIARKVAAGGAVSRSRPLCVYPQRATYKGSGSVDDADSFVCK